MAMELWILLAIAGVGLAAGLVNRVRRTHKGGEDAAAKNIYTLW